MRRVFIAMLVFLLPSAGVCAENLKPQPVFHVIGKILEYSDTVNKMKIEIFKVGGLVKPGLYGSYMRDKYKAGDKILANCVLDKRSKVDVGNIVEGDLERLGEDKNAQYNFFNIKVVAANQKLYNLKSRFDKDTAVFKTELYGTDGN